MLKFPSNGIQALRVRVLLVRLRGNRQRNHPRLLLEKQRGSGRSGMLERVWV
jgi:hypothetical protein